MGVRVEDIDRLVDELVGLLGVHEPRQLAPVRDALAHGGAIECLRALARQMGLPIAPRLATSASHPHLTGASLARTDAHGRGFEGIPAKILLSEALPLYGSRALDGYPVDVYVGEQLLQMPPDTIITILAHELSHVILFSLKHPRRDDEKVTDLVPIVLGYGDVVHHGRRWTTVRPVSDRTEQVTTHSVGYLTEAELGQARVRVSQVIAKHVKLRADCSRLVDECERQVAVLSSLDEEFTRRLVIVDSLRPSVSVMDGRRLARFHSPIYLDPVRSQLRQARDVLARTGPQVAPRHHHTDQALRLLDGQATELKSMMKKLATPAAMLERDVGVLRRATGRRARFLVGLRRSGLALKRLLGVR